MVEATLIVRSCGERTTEACLRMLGRPAHLITGTPFSDTLRRAFERGIGEGRPYTVMVDADVLPYMHLVPTLMEAAEADTGDWFQKHALIFCKLFGRRGAGNRIYRTALLPRALDLIDRYRLDERPETAIIRDMATQGHGRAEIPRVVGLHGWEQSYRDLYRVAYVHAVKSRDRIEKFLPKWGKAALRGDHDYIVALKGAADGARHVGPITIDAGSFSWGAADKPPLLKWDSATVKAWKKAGRKPREE